MRIRLSLLCFVAAVAAGSLPRRAAAENPTPATIGTLHSSTAAPLPKHFSFIPDCARDCVNHYLSLLWKDPQAACKDWKGNGNVGVDTATSSSQKVEKQIDGCVKEWCPLMRTSSFMAGLKDTCVFPSSSINRSEAASKSVSSTLSTTPPSEAAGIASPSAVKDTNDSKHSKTLSGGALAAVIIIPIVFLLLVGAVMWLLRRRHINRRNQSRSMPFDHPPPQGPVSPPSSTGWTALDSHHSSYAGDGSWGMLDEHQHDRIPSRAMSNAPNDYHHLENDPPPHPGPAGDIRSNYANNNSFLRPPTPVSELGYVGTSSPGPGYVGTSSPNPGYVGTSSLGPGYVSSSSLGPGYVGSSSSDLGYVGMARPHSDVISPVSPMSSFRAGGNSSMRHASISTIDSVAPPRPPAPGEEPIGIARADSVSWRREIEHAAERAASRVVALEQQRVGNKSKPTRGVGETGREEWPLFGKRGSWGSRKSAGNAEGR